MSGTDASSTTQGTTNRIGGAATSNEKQFRITVNLTCRQDFFVTGDSYKEAFKKVGETRRIMSEQEHLDRTYVVPGVEENVEINKIDSLESLAIGDRYRNFKDCETYTLTDIMEPESANGGSRAVVLTDSMGRDHDYPDNAIDDEFCFVGSALDKGFEDVKKSVLPEQDSDAMGR